MLCASWVHKKFWILFLTGVQTMLNHIWFVCYHNIVKVLAWVSGLPQKPQKHLILRLRKCLLQREGVAWCIDPRLEQRGLDFYRKWQISQSDCEITSNCGKKILKISRGCRDTNVLSAWQWLPKVCEKCSFLALKIQFVIEHSKEVKYFAICLLPGKWSFYVQFYINTIDTRHQSTFTAQGAVYHVLH